MILTQPYISAVTMENCIIAGTVAVLDGGDRKLAYRIFKKASNGNVTVNTDGIWTYVPAENYHGSDSFTVEVSDDNGENAYSDFAITVKPMNLGNGTDKAEESSAQIKIITPGCGEIWRAGTIHIIKWMFKGKPGCIKINLVKNGIIIYKITEGNLKRSGKYRYKWKIPSSISEGGDYRIKISGASDLEDESSNLFTIFRPQNKID